MTFKVVQGDLFTIKADAIVINGGTDFNFDSVTCKHAFKRCGDDLRKSLNKYSTLPICGCVSLPPLGLQTTKHIIYSAVPYVDDKNNKLENDIFSAMDNCINLALDYGCKSIAFPLMSTGTNSMNKRKIINIMLEVLSSEDRINTFLVIYNKNTFHTYSSLFKKYKIVPGVLSGTICKEVEQSRKNPKINIRSGKIDVYKALKDETTGNTFCEKFKYYMSMKTLSNCAIYPYIISKNYYYKIINNKVTPDRNIIISLGYYMDLKVEQINDLLSVISSSLQEGNDRDKIIINGLMNEIYIDNLNIELKDAGFEPLIYKDID